MEDKLHPLGLALSYDNESLASDGVLVAPDGIFEFSDKSNKNGNEKYTKFIEGRK